MSLGKNAAFMGRTLRKVHDRRRDPPPSDWDGVTNFDEK
jgi:hypothetical protein